jgi:hypothetical protein
MVNLSIFRLICCIKRGEATADHRSQNKVAIRRYGKGGYFFRAVRIFY